MATTIMNSTAGIIYDNATSTFMGQFNEISQYNVHLNVAERLWAAWYAYMQNDVLATGIMSFVMHETVYFGRSLPWIIIGQMSYFNKYKIQAVRICHPEESSSLTLSGQDAHSGRTMELRKTCTSKPLHSRTPTNLALPPNVQILWHGYRCSISFPRQDRSSNCSFLRSRGRVALLVTSCSPLGPSLQKHPQNPPSILSTFRTSSRICLSNRSHDPRFRNS